MEHTTILALSEWCYAMHRNCVQVDRLVNCEAILLAIENVAWRPLCLPAVLKCDENGKILEKEVLCLLRERESCWLKTKRFWGRCVFHGRPCHIREVFSSFEVLTKHIAKTCRSLNNVCWNDAIQSETRQRGLKRDEFKNEMLKIRLKSEDTMKMSLELTSANFQCNSILKTHFISLTVVSLCFKMLTKKSKTLSKHFRFVVCIKLLWWTLIWKRTKWPPPPFPVKHFYTSIVRTVISHAYLYCKKHNAVK